MAELASLQIKVVRDGIEQAQKALNDLAKAADNAEKSSGGVTKGFEDSGKKTRSFAGDVMAAGKMIGAAYIAKQIGDIGIACIKAAADMEQQKVAFTTMLGSAEKANTLLRDMTEFAAKTPFELPQIVDAGKRMLAFGYAQEEIIDNLRIMGDIAAGLSMPVGDLVYLMGGIKAQGKAMTVDLMQFANRGLPIYEELAKVLKISTGQVKDFASQGKIGFKDVEQAFKNLTSEGGKFAGLMDAQSKTLAGQWSNFNDQLDVTKRMIGDSLAPAASDLISIASEGLSKINGMLKNDTPDSITMTGSIIKDVKNILNGTADTVEAIGASIGDIKVEEIINDVKKWEASSTGVSAKVDELMGKYGKVNAAAGIYSEYVKGHVKLTDEQVKNLENILSLYNKTLTASNPLGDEYYKNMAERFKKLGGGGEDKKGKGNTSAAGEGKYNYASELKYARDTALSGKSAEFQLLSKYQDEISRLETFQAAAVKAGDKDGALAAWEAQIAATKKYQEELKKLTDAADGFGIAMKDVGKQLANTAIYAAADGFEKIGEALGKGEMSGKAMKKIMAEMVWQIIEALPMMFVAAGVNLIAQGGIPMLPVGLSLIGMGLAGQIGVGYVNGRIAAKEAEGTTDAAAHGAVYGFARGGSFTNEIVNSPTRFMFSRGGTTGRGLMGEAGTEAVVPLRRMSNGNLGVESSGGGEVNVTIINGSGEPVNVKKEKGSNGGQDITVTVGAIVSKQLAEGAYDSAFRARYGIGRRGV